MKKIILFTLLFTMISCGGQEDDVISSTEESSSSSTEESSSSSTEESSDTTSTSTTTTIPEKETTTDVVYTKGEIIDVAGSGSEFYKREVTINGVRIVAAGNVGGQQAVPDAFIEKVARMVELFTDPNGDGIDANAQITFIKTLKGDPGTYHAGIPTLQRVARG